MLNVGKNTTICSADIVHGCGHGSFKVENHNKPERGINTSRLYSDGVRPI